MQATGIPTKCAMLCIAILCIFFVLIEVVYAQFSGLATDVTLTLNPRYPTPNSEVEVSLNAYSINTAGASISWYRDGVELTEFKNERSITLSTGDLGTSQNISAIIASQGSVPIRTEALVRAAAIDFILEADTTVPAFYKGRALPSANAPLRVSAIPHLNTGESATSYSYEWKLNNKVLFGGAVLGKQSADISFPTFGNALLSVTIYDRSGAVIGGKLARISKVEPELYFYEENPLRGLSRKAIVDTFALVGEETTVRAEPYFINKNMGGADTAYEWRVNGEFVNTGNADPQTITLRKTGGSGTANVGFQVDNTKQLFQSVAGSFRIFFE